MEREALEKNPRAIQKILDL